MAGRDYTDLGGAGYAFMTTHWSLIESIRTGDDSSHALIGSLLKNYWKPIYCYLRRHGYGNEEAKDLTQAFFHEIVLGNELVQQADQRKGRFREAVRRATGPTQFQPLRCGRTRSMRKCGTLILLFPAATRQNGRFPGPTHLKRWGRFLGDRV